MASNKTFNAGIEIAVTDRASSWIRKITNNFETLDKAGKKAAQSFELAANLKQSAEGVANFSRGVASAVKAPITKMMEFEEIMSSVRANTFNGEDTAETQAAFKALSETARRLGADTKYSGKEAAEGMVNLATAGFSAQQQMEAMPGVLNLAAAANESIADSAEISASAMAQFGLAATDMGRIGDVIAKTAQTSQTGLLDLGEALKYAGVSAKNAGVSIEETTAMLGVLGDAGVKGSAAGTTLRSVLSSLQAPSKKGKSALDFLGINTKDKAGNMRPINEILAQMDAAMDKKFGKDKNGNRRAALLKGLFDEANAANASLLIAGAGDGKVGAKITDNRGAAGTAAKVAADMSNNTAGAAKELDSALEELQLTIGEALIPAVTELLKWSKEVTASVTTWAKENPVLVQTIGYLAGGIAIFGAGLWATITAMSAYATAKGLFIKVTGLAGTAMQLFSGGFITGMKGITAATLASPLGWIMALATGVALIYEYWEPISEFFSTLWADVTKTFKESMEWILNKLGWVGDEIRSASDSVLSLDGGTPEEAANSRAQAAGLFADDLDTSQTGAKALGDGSFTALAAARNATEGMGVIKGAMAGPLQGFEDGRRQAAGDADFAALTTGMEKFAAAQGAPALAGPAAVGKYFDGNLMITINSDGSVTKTELTTKGEPPFETRVNRGKAAA
jgi:TP901 family phage tail tape measure protein